MASPVPDAALARFLRGTTRSGTLDELVASVPRRRGDVPAAEASAAEGASRPDLSRRALEKLARGVPLDGEERFHVEAIVIPARRLAIDVIGGDFTTRHADWLHLLDEPAHGVLRAAFGCVGRVDIVGHPTLTYGGTGFVAGPGLLVTNRHVASLFAQGVGTAGLRFAAGLAAQVDFLRERTRAETAIHRLVRVVMIHPHWDMAVLAVEGLAASPSLRLAVDPDEARSGRPLAVIGYPTFDPRNPGDVQFEVFGGVYGVKRLQPGLSCGRGRVESDRHAVEALLHDSSTLAGNSGSCVLDLATGHVLGLHFGGRYAVANYAVPASELAGDGRVIDAGLAFAGAPTRRRTAWDARWAALAHPPARPPADPQPEPDPMAASESSTIRITVPIELSISIGTVQAGGVAVQADAGAAQPAVGQPQTTEPQTTGPQTTGPAAERAVEPDHDTDYANRTGYDPNFLGTDVPSPTASDPSVLCVPQGGGTLLHYRHFSIAMHRRRRLALFTASNVTAEAGLKRPENRPDADYTRRGLGGLDRNDRERWFGDPRIRADEQLPDRFFEQDRGSFDKGHVVRREDVAWGRTYAEMRAANGDTFYVTNCTPQISAFNQASRGEDNWGDLEDLVQAHAKTERLAVFAGPVLASDDPVFTGLDTEGPVAVPVPVRFWKVIVANGEGGLQAFGFLLEQDLSAVALEFTVPARWRRFMAPLTRIETLTGVDFPALVRAADQHDRRSGRQFREAAESGPAAGGTTTAGSPGPAAAAPTAPVPEIGEILAAWKAQAGTPSVADVRFVVELAAPLSDPTLEAIVARTLGLPVAVGPLFAADRDLDRFRVVEIRGVVSDDRADLFDVARALNAAFGSRSVEPDVAARYFDDDRPPPAEGTAESADSAFWCWVPDTPGTRPRNPDWALRETSTYQAWTFSEESGKPPQGDGIVVFQPDTGVVPWHQELPPGIAQDGRAANFVEGVAGAVDPLTGGGNPGHGTGTGSVVASPQGGAMSGSAPRATLVPLRCVTSVAVFNQSRVAQAVDHARRHGAHVITMSLGGVPSQALHEAIRKAVDDNVVVVAAAGNCVGTVVWPARYDEVIAVGGVNETFRPWKGSSRGSAVDISGPAEFVLRAEATDAASPDKVGGGQGTSFATAHLAGLAACWLAHHGRDAIVASLAPGETLQQRFLAKLAQTATVPPDFDRDEYGAGIVNASKLLRADALTAGAAEAARRRRSVEEQVAELLAEAGAGGLEAAGTVRREPQNVLELACIGLDLARRGQASGVRLEAQPPPAMSRGLRRALGRTAGGGR